MSPKRAGIPQARIRKLQRQVRALRNAILNASDYQPMYNGRTSCPFCENFTDGQPPQGWHDPACIVLKLRGKP